MKKTPLVLLASARKQSDTGQFAKIVFSGIDHDTIDLLDYPIAPFNYLHEYPAGDLFLKVIDKLLHHKIIVFATPVYWYAMSGLMKTFLDRLTDLVTTQTHIGRQLRGRSVFLLAVGADKELPDGFEVPFRLSSDYLGMFYSTFVYCPTNELKTNSRLDTLIKPFVDKLQSVS